MGGLQNQEDHIEKSVKMAIRMQESTNNFKIATKFKIRIGIAVGDVVTGVLGKSRLTFDCFGDAVQLAMLLEEHSEPGCILVTKEVRDATVQKFKFIERPSIKVIDFNLLSILLVWRQRYPNLLCTW